MFVRSEFLIALDLSAATSAEELHAVLARGFGFPQYYGKNRDAFNDCIGDFIALAREGRVRVRCRGFGKLEERLPQEATWLRGEFEELGTANAWDVVWEN